MKLVNSKKTYSWVLLRHAGAPDDIRGVHFDLLLEDKEFCRTWRLSDIPVLDGPYVDSVYIVPHSLEWLNIKEKVLSGNRGVATRVKKGIFFNLVPGIEKSFIKLSLNWEDVESDLLINEKGCRVVRKKNNYCLEHIGA